MKKVIYSPNMKTVVIYLENDIRICSTKGLRKYADKHNIPLRTYRDLSDLLHDHDTLPKYVEYQNDEPEQLALKIGAMA